MLCECKELSPSAKFMWVDQILALRGPAGQSARVRAAGPRTGSAAGETETLARDGGNKLAQRAASSWRQQPVANSATAAGASHRRSSEPVTSRLPVRFHAAAFTHPVCQRASSANRGNGASESIRWPYPIRERPPISRDRSRDVDDCRWEARLREWCSIAAGFTLRPCTSWWCRGGGRAGGAELRVATIGGQQPSSSA